MKHLIGIPAFLCATFAQGSVFDYLTGYKIGIELLGSRDEVEVDYTVAGQGTEGCIEEDTLTQRCTVGMTSPGSSGFGLFLAQPFKAKGNWYFGADLGFSLRYLKGGVDDQAILKQEQRGLPLRELSYELITFTLKPYVQLGWTPQGSKIPDILFSFGPAFQVAVGEVSLNETPENVVVLSGSNLVFGFVETEVIFYRFSGGSFSLFSPREVTGDDKGTPFYPKEKDGMSELRARFRSTESGGFLSMFGLRYLTSLP